MCAQWEALMRRRRKKQVNAPVGSDTFERRMERQRARRAFDKKNGKAARKGKDISHNKMLKDGGSNKDGYKLESPSKNRARNGHKPKPKK
jgi:hypothetical protein